MRRQHNLQICEIKRSVDNLEKTSRQPSWDKRAIRTIWFDYYGTLVDVGQPFAKIEEWFSSFLRQSNAKCPPHDFFMRFSRERAKQLHQETFALGEAVLRQSYLRTCDRYPDKPWTAEFQRFITALFTMPKAYPSAMYVVDVLRKRYRVGLLTNADNKILLESITSQGFLFDFIVTSENAKANKPDPRIFHMAMELAGGFPEQMVMIGDSFAEDIQPAQDMGMQTLWVKTDDRAIAERTGNSVPELREILQYLR